MPTERRKLQNRVNQRRYRMQTKNRIQMLEKAIIDSGVAIGLDLRISRPTATEGDEASSEPLEPLSSLTPFADDAAALVSDFQGVSVGGFDSSLDPLDKTNFFTGQDFLESWGQPNFSFIAPPSSLSTPDSLTGQSNGSFSNRSLQSGLPWQEPPTPQGQTPDLLLSPSKPNDYEGTICQPRNQSIYSNSASGPPEKFASKLDLNEPKKRHIIQTRARAPREKTIACLREENKRLKELSVALISMYCATGRTRLSEKEMLLCHNLQATAKNCITPPPFNRLPDNALDDGIALNSISSHSEQLDNAGLHISVEPVVRQLPMPDLELPGLSADLTGFLSQNDALLEAAADPGAWDSHPNHPSTAAGYSFPYAHAAANLDLHPSPFHPITIPLVSDLPLPSSYAYLEPTFSRRLVRLLWEYAFMVLTHASIHPAQVNRCFGFCLRSRSKESLIRKFFAYLGLSSAPVSELDRQAWNAAPDVRDSIEGDCDECDDWMEAGKVETYLATLGFSLAENGTQGIVKCNPAAYLPRSVEGGAEKDNVHTRPRATIVSYRSKWQPDSCFMDTLFDDDGNFKVPASWFMPDAVDTAESLVAPQTSLAPVDAERFVPSGSECYLNVDLFFIGLIDVAVCLGRAAGFRRTEVDKVLKKSVVRC